MRWDSGRETQARCKISYTSGHRNCTEVNKVNSHDSKTKPHHKLTSNLKFVYHVFFPSSPSQQKSSIAQSSASGMSTMIEYPYVLISYAHNYRLKMGITCFD